MVEGGAVLQGQMLKEGLCEDSKAASILIAMVTIQVLSWCDRWISLMKWRNGHTFHWSFDVL